MKAHGNPFAVEPSRQRVGEGPNLARVPALPDASDIRAIEEERVAPLALPEVIDEVYRPLRRGER